MAAAQVKAGVEKCRVLDNLIFAFLLSVNRLNEDRSRVEGARTPEFGREARMDFERCRRKCENLHELIVMHCLTHRC